MYELRVSSRNTDLNPVGSVCNFKIIKNSLFRESWNLASLWKNVNVIKG